MNTVDRRRRLGPSSALPLSFPPSEPKEVEHVKNEKLFIKLSNIPTATGSSFIQSGNNILLASVYGPRPSFKRTFNTKAVIKISFHASPFLSTVNSLTETTEANTEYQITESVILSTLETACANLILLDNYPKSTIDIFVNLINTDNTTKFINLLPIIHNAVNMALIDSGIALKNFPTAVVSKDNVFINSIHSNVYNEDSTCDIQNEEILTLYIPNTESTDLAKSLTTAIEQARSLRGELTQFCFNNM